ncbi:hypothetical protein H9X85_02985 [Anaerotignum lactatifermentans]|uniref:DUF4179 domain-containing protein n=1 Tax=Anaerotignum lactatifermentans TaxID=160404 RepID=A0ABS2GAL9_9FIRM|nr:hypothetical protein [Anaerotignum lactatifermentans]MBM6828597.1 hypothetical protein [Anaerotignum lactatifermentans]MBM6878531.1 hypothetical protein [Anaerotignum lactatifermentans]MBM6950179.1 hypothetical protein [Anaerotignum lactatifermentans]
MKREWSNEEIDRWIKTLEEDGLLEAPPSLEQNVMRRIAHMDEEKGRQQRHSPQARKFFYQLKICAAMAASLFLVFSSGSIKKEGEHSVFPVAQEYGLADRLAAGTDHLSRQISDISGFLVEQIMEVTSYEK